MRIPLLSASLLGLFTCLSPEGARGQSALPTEHGSWWIQTYGLVDAKTNDRVRHAHEVFERLAAAADKRANRMPRLVIIRTDGSPFAMALSDGTILLTEGALRICYRGVSAGTGHARLAFVLGHELSHLANDDFWHAAAFSAFTSYGTEGKARDALGPVFERTPDEARRVELQADAFGMLYMTTAGYEPRAVLGNGNFFNEWARQMESLGAVEGESHPEPQQRSAFLETQMKAVIEDLDLYDFGVRLFELGRFEDAIVLLEKFGDRFPSLEVLNNVGLSHLQLAAWFLSRCDERMVVAFKLPTVLDPATRARRLRTFEAAPSPCLRIERFDHHYKEAERYLREAAEKSPDYLPARLNLLSLFILGQKGAEALAAAQAAREVSPDDPRVLAARAAAMYLVERETNVRMADAVIEELQVLRRKYPQAPDVAYNLGAILSERRRVESAKTAWQAFLLLEPDGIYADVVREYLGASAPSTPLPSTPLPEPKPPVPLGELNLSQIEARFPQVETRQMEIGAFNVRILRSDGWRAFAMESVVEVVEEKIEPPLEARAARARYGHPVRSLSTLSGEVMYYPNFAVEIVNGLASALLFFGEIHTH
jgi:tetratricopeptide (TPR) repeat protein